MIVPMTVTLSALRNEPADIILLDDEAKKIPMSKFVKEMDKGYRAAIVIVPIVSGIQVKMAIITPYHRDKYLIDTRFLKEKFHEYCRVNNHLDWIPASTHDYFIVEIEYN